MLRIDKIEIKNYRQYRNFELSFDEKSGKNNLHIVIGANDTGKTNLLNAINWCLYGDEPHLGKKKEKMPILNTNVINELIQDGGKAEVEVKLSARDGDHKLKFIRNYSCVIHDGNNTPAIQNKDYNIFHTFPTGNTEIYPVEESHEIVNKFIPKHLRKFFFFDGEEIKTYFKSELASQIKQHVFDLSNIDLLERVQERLTKCHKDIRRDISKLNPKLQRIEAELEGLEKRIENLNNKRESAKIQMEKAEEKYDELKSKLTGLPDTDEIQNEIDKLVEKRDDKENKMISFIRDKNEFLLDHFILLSVIPAWNTVIEIIDRRRENNELPPPYDPEEVEKIVDEKFCRLCQRELDKESIREVKDLLDTLEIDSKLNRELQSMELPIKTRIRDINSFKRKIRKLNASIDDYQNDIEYLNKRILELENKLSGHDKDQISQWHKDMKDWEGILREEAEKFHDAKAEIKITKREIKKKEEKLDKEREKEDKAKYLNKEEDFTKASLEYVTKMKKSIMNDTKKELENLTKEYFFDLIWKKETYKDVKIDENYNVNLIHKDGYSCYGTAGAAVRQFFALSFTLALHEVSGFDAQLIIDTPVGRTSGEHRENLAETIKRVSEDKQIILLFTPDEYDNKISKRLDPIASNRYSLKMIKEENETYLEAL